MAKSVHTDVLDAALAVIATADRISVCSTQPTTYTEAITTYKLAISTTPTFTGPAAGDVSGRKITVDQETLMTVDASGTAAHVALCISGTTKLLLVTTCTSQVLTAGNTVNIPAWDDEIADPS